MGICKKFLIPGCYIECLCFASGCFTEVKNAFVSSDEYYDHWAVGLVGHLNAALFALTLHFLSAHYIRPGATLNHDFCAALDHDGSSTRRHGRILSQRWTFSPLMIFLEIQFPHVSAMWINYREHNRKIISKLFPSSNHGMYRATPVSHSFGYLKLLLGILKLGWWDIGGAGGLGLGAR